MPSESRVVWPVPEVYANVTMRDWKEHGDPDVYTAVDWWYRTSPQRIYRLAGNKRDKVGTGLVLTGQPGTGKTMLACCVINQLEEKKWTTAFVRGDEFDEVARLARFTNMAEGDEEAWRLLHVCGCVVVDDVLRLGGDPTRLESLLRSRWERGLPTIMTVNDGAPLMSGTLLSFLRPFTWVEFEGRDLRV